MDAYREAKIMLVKSRQHPVIYALLPGAVAIYLAMDFIAQNA